MNYEFQRIQQALKTIMRSKKLTYQTIAKALKISPATVKRRLNGDDLSLKHLKEFAETLSVSFYELIELSKQNQREPHLFTEEQEKLLSRDLRNMLAFRLIISGQNFSQIKTSLKLSDKELRVIAKAFDRVGLSQLLPGDRFIPLVHFPFKWQLNGPLSNAFDQMILENLFTRIKTNPENAGLHRQFEFALSSDIYKKFCRETEDLFLKYRGLSELHLSSKIQLEEMVSGILFIDRFSLWDISSRQP